MLAEVVGFANDRAFLMPAGDVQGLSSGASVVPLAPYVPVPRLGEAAAQATDRCRCRACCACRWARACWAVWWMRMASRWTGWGRLLDVALASAGPQADQRHGPRAGARAAGHRRACHQRPADRGPRPAHRPVCRLRRGQERAAGHDGALHPGRRDRGRPDRRTRPRGQGIHRGHPGRGGPRALRRGGRAGRRAAAAAHAGRLLRHGHGRRVSATRASMCCC